MLYQGPQNLAVGEAQFLNPHPGLCEQSKLRKLLTTSNDDFNYDYEGKKTELMEVASNDSDSATKGKAARSTELHQVFNCMRNDLQEVKELSNMMTSIP